MAILLDKYVADCESLRSDLQSLADDLRYTLESRGRIIYAIDFTEIYAFVFPEESARRMRVFSDDSDEEMQLALHRALNVLFFGLPDGVLLLPPYALELESWVPRIRHRALVYAAEHAAAALREAQKVVDMPEFRQMAELVNRTNETGGSVQTGDKELELAVKFLETNMSRLLLLIDKTYTQPLQRLQHLLKRGHFQDLSDILDSIPDPDNEALRRWEEDLSARRDEQNREPASSYLDALAIATIKAANALLAERNIRTRIRLVTRSSLMQAIMNRQSEQQYWLDGKGNIIRHPRSFSAFNTFDITGAKHAIKQAEQLIGSITVFIDSFKERRRDVAGDNLFIDIQNIKRQWNLSAELATPISKSFQVYSEGDDSGSSIEPRSRVISLFRSIKGQADLIALLSERIVQLMNDIEREYQNLGFELQVQVPEHRALLERAISSEAKQDRSILKSTLYFIPYELQFYSPELQEFMKYFEGGVGVSSEALLDLLKQGLKASIDYERLLFMAYIFGVWNRWSLAEQYCELALKAHVECSGIPIVEGLFFKAICLRCNELSAERYQSARRLLHEAGKIKASMRSDSNYKDPRFLKEEAALLFIWNEIKTQADKSRRVRSDPGLVQKAIELSQQALELIEADQKLKAQIHNNLCYQYIVFGTARDLEQAKEQLVLLEATQESIENDKKRWPPGVLHTVGYARWVLSDRKPSAQEYEEILELFELALSNRDVTRQDKKRVMKHREEVEARGHNGLAAD